MARAATDVVSVNLSYRNGVVAAEVEVEVEDVAVVVASTGFVTGMVEVEAGFVTGMVEVEDVAAVVASTGCVTGMMLMGEVPFFLFVFACLCVCVEGSGVSGCFLPSSFFLGDAVFFCKVISGTFPFSFSFLFFCDYTYTKSNTPE